jgi:hypothetical protein
MDVRGPTYRRDAAFRSDVSAVRRFGAIAEKGGEKCGLEHDAVKYDDL